MDENNADSEEERVIESYKRQRIEEMKKESMRSRRFGSVIPIGRAEYTREVTEASEEPEPDEEEKDKTEEVLKGTPVICLLYQEGYACRFFYFTHRKGRSLVLGPIGMSLQACD